MTEPRTKLDPDEICNCGDDDCGICSGWRKWASEHHYDAEKGAWVDNHSWQPEEPPLPIVENLPSPSVVEEPQPGSIAYLEMGCDELYRDLGGEG